MTHSSAIEYAPSCEEILSQFEDVVAFRGGQIQKPIISNDKMFLRAHNLDGLSGEVAKNDRFDGGMALRVSGPQVSVHLYTFREVCKNGMIMSESHDTKRMLRLPKDEFSSDSKYLCLSELREMLFACATPEIFSQNMNVMRRLRNESVDTGLNIVAQLQQDLGDFAADVLEMVLSELFKEEDMTLYGVANAITAVARETSDPQTKWDLEELGGGIGAKLFPLVDPDSSQSRISHEAYIDVACA